MKRISKLLGFSAVSLLALSQTAHALDIDVPAGEITTSTIWTADNVYRLKGQVYVTNGATLTIEKGTVIASLDADEGSLAITRGSQIIAEGTKAEPIIFTSQSDRNTWTGDDPLTSVWRQANSEWGNVTIMGNAYISNKGKKAGVDEDPRESGNSKNAGNNVALMEGLIPSGPSDNKTLYGGTNDNDDSGTLKYVSTRFTGKVVGLGNELNALSLGGVGRMTDIEYIDIMNNVDDGIEIWGGTVNIKYANIWNIGDDSLDIDQGWRGKAQYIFIVQGFSGDDSQGSGVGDNMVEIDGAEAADAHPVTTATIYNLTAVGEPINGDRATEWRDGARVQIRQSIIMDAGDDVVLVPGNGSDGEGIITGYGFNGTLPFYDAANPDIWDTPYTSTSAVNANPAPGSASAPSNATLYQSQSAGNAPGQGFLTEITDSVFYRNVDYGSAQTVGVVTNAAAGAFNGGGETNAAKSNVIAAWTANADENMPIVSVTHTPVTLGTVGNSSRVTSIDPRAANDAVNSVGTPPNDGFFDSSANFRGAFGPNPNDNWILDWTTAYANGFVVDARPPSGNVDVPAGDINTSTTWTSNNVYRLKGQVYVTNGATLTIEEGTVIASLDEDEGSLAITRGSQIIAEGTRENPIIFTSQSDRDTWTDDDPLTSVWRQSNSEWGNLTIMGNAYISNKGKKAGVDEDPRESGNTKSAGNNVALMEGLVPSGPSDNKTLYGGTNDDDDSGSLKYVSTRYTGKVVGLGNELNALSLGGVGRMTDIDYIDLMNNVDDGIEIWGGAVNIKHVNIWNIGDDSLDIDQGWRGKAQYIFIVQGFSSDESQGSGVGDNMVEIDGAEAADAHPVTTATIYNLTAIGEPVNGDRATEWRDGARVQIRQSIIMDAGDDVVLVPGNGSDGEGIITGYGFNGTLPFYDANNPDIWDTPYTQTSQVNANGLPGSAQAPTNATLYQAQSAGNAAGQGFLSEITDSVFFRNLDYGVTDQVGVTINADATGGFMGTGEVIPAKDNVLAAWTSVANENMPIKDLVRIPVVLGTVGNSSRVTSVDPRAANAAVSSAGTPPNDGFFDTTTFRGAFGPSANDNWILDWTTAYANGFVIDARGEVVPAFSGWVIY